MACRGLLLGFSNSRVFLSWISGSPNFRVSYFLVLFRKRLFLRLIQSCVYLIDASCRALFSSRNKPFQALCYFFPLIGGVIADAWLGKFWTILSLSIVYLIGMVLMTVSAVPGISGNDDNEPGEINRVFALVALLVVAIGTGGIKPCVSALGERI